GRMAADSQVDNDRSSGHAGSSHEIIRWSASLAEAVEMHFAAVPARSSGSRQHLFRTKFPRSTCARGGLRYSVDPLAASERVEKEACEKMQRFFRLVATRTHGALPAWCSW